MRDQEKLARGFDALHPYAGTAREVFKNHELTESEQIAALALIPLECPWFSRIVYMRACHAAAQVLMARA